MPRAHRTKCNRTVLWLLGPRRDEVDGLSKDSVSLVKETRGGGMRIKGGQKDVYRAEIFITGCPGPMGDEMQYKSSQLRLQWPLETHRRNFLGARVEAV